VLPQNLLPRIDALRCTGCQRCVEICPTQALAQVHDKATLAFPDRCTYCTACEDVCPENAIALPFQVVFAPSQRTPALAANNSPASTQSLRHTHRTHSKGGTL
jgi:formate hydrogenlyase subunit 6/NADH:ubiquinone oxidoreductase subunit I